MTAIATARREGDVILKLDNISLAFGGVKALTDVSFNVLEHEVRAIIGPNGAGKSSMLNVINGVYHPQDGTITFRGQVRRNMNPHQAAVSGIARTFQNIALFRGMTTSSSRRSGSGARAARSSRTAARSRRSSTSSRYSTSARRRSGACRTDCRSGSSSRARAPPHPRCCCSPSRGPA